MAEIRLLFRTGAGKVRQAIVERCGPLAGESFYSRVRASSQCLGIWSLVLDVLGVPKCRVCAVRLVCAHAVDLRICGLIIASLHSLIFSLEPTLK